MCRKTATHCVEYSADGYKTGDGIVAAEPPVAGVQEEESDGPGRRVLGPHEQSAYCHETLGPMTHVTETAQCDGGLGALPTGVVDRAS